MNEIRIPLDQYAYINVKFDGTPDEALQEYRRLMALSKAPVTPETGLPVKVWNQTLDNYLMTGNITEDLYTGMSDRQRLLINEIKKSLNRIKAKDDTGRINKEQDVRYN